MLKNLLGLLSVDMGIDLGTANTLVSVRGKGVILSEPSVVAVQKGTHAVLLRGLAVGQVAKEMEGKTPGSIDAIRPLKDGVISDFDVTEAMLAYFIRKAANRRWGFRPRVVIAVPSGITAIERRAVTNSAERAGARRVFLIDEPMAAAIGIGLPIEEPQGSMVVDIGGGTTEVAVISLAGMVTCKSIRIAGDEMDAAIIAYLAETYNLQVGQPTAEKIKRQIGSAWPDEESVIEVKGQDRVAGLPRRATVRSEEIREALAKPLGAIVEAIKQTLEETPPELAADLIDRGIVVTGGGALLRGLDRMLAHETGVAVTIAEEPMTSVAHGTAILLERLDLLSTILDGNPNGF